MDKQDRTIAALVTWQGVVMLEPGPRSELMRKLHEANFYAVYEGDEIRVQKDRYGWAGVDAIVDHKTFFQLLRRYQAYGQREFIEGKKREMLARAAKLRAEADAFEEACNSLKF